VSAGPNYFCGIFNFRVQVSNHIQGHATHHSTKKEGGIVGHVWASGSIANRGHGPLAELYPIGLPLIRHTWGA
jgi:hypothetical protein